MKRIKRGQCAIDFLWVNEGFVNGCLDDRRRDRVNSDMVRSVEGLSTKVLNECLKRKDKKGELRFRLKASNGEPILAREDYKSRASYRNGIASAQKKGPNPDRYIANTYTC